MKKTVMKISDIKLNPNNHRTIRNDPIVIMRLAKELGYTKVV